MFLCRETWREYETVSLPVEEGAARVLLEERLAEQLAALLGEDGREVSRVCGGAGAVCAGHAGGAGAVGNRRNTKEILL